jgi:hypothetical protein
MSKADEELKKLEKKLSVAVSLMVASGHRLPGVRGWELRRRLGKNYPKLIESLNSKLKEVGLQVKIIHDQEAEVGDLDRARFYIVLSDPLNISDIPTLGYSLDELAVLSATLAYLFTKNEKANYKEVVEMLETKYQKWRVESILERLSRKGYLVKNDDGTISIGWRTKVEVDKQELLKAFVNIAGQEKSSNPPDEQPDTST